MLDLHWKKKTPENQQNKQQQTLTQTLAICIM